MVKHESQTRHRSAAPDREVWVLHGGAEAGRADHRAVAARQAAAGDVVPAGMLGVVVEQVADVGGVHRPAHMRGSSASTTCSAASTCRSAARHGLKLVQHAAPRSLPAASEEPVCSPSSNLGQREVVARLRPGTGAHRHAEARAARVGADHRDEECGLSPGGVTRVRVRPGLAAPGRGSRARAGRRTECRGWRTAGRQGHGPLGPQRRRR